MNEQIKIRTQKKLDENKVAKEHLWTININEQKHDYIVLPFVFSPAIFFGTEWLTKEVLQNLHQGIQFLEIGIGCGVTSIQVALRIKNCKVTGSDINVTAIENALINSKRLQANLGIVQSDMFDQFKGRKYDVIYWNYPFHPTNKTSQQLSILEKAVMDPQYKMLRKYLLTASKHLKEKGYLLLGFSYVMGDIQLLKELAQQNNWSYEELAKMVEGGSICLIKLEQL